MINISWLDKSLLTGNSYKFVKVAVFMLCFVPLLKLSYRLIYNPIGLGANPAETIIRGLGDWTINFLLIGLLITPLRFFTGVNQLIKFRRMIGLFAFFYMSLHLLAYLGFDRVFLWGEIIEDVIKRPFIAVGFAAFVLILPLAITSTKGWIMRMGGKGWAKLHKLVYLIALLGVVHYWWLVKRDITWPVIYAVILTCLMLLRQEKIQQLMKKYSPFRK